MWGCCQLWASSIWCCFGHCFGPFRCGTFPHVWWINAIGCVSCIHWYCSILPHRFPRNPSHNFWYGLSYMYDWFWWCLRLNVPLPFCLLPHFNSSSIWFYFPLPWADISKPRGMIILMQIILYPLPGCCYYFISGSLPFSSAASISVVGKVHSTFCVFYPSWDCLNSDIVDRTR